MIIDGKEYVLKEEEKKGLQPKVLVLPNPENTVGIGTAKIMGGYVAVKLSLCYLKRSIEVLEKIICDDSSVYIAWSTDEPAIIGNLNDSGDEIAGIIIAPRITNGDIKPYQPNNGDSK